MARGSKSKNKPADFQQTFQPPASQGEGASQQANAKTKTVAATAAPAAAPSPQATQAPVPPVEPGAKARELARKTGLAARLCAIVVLVLLLLPWVHGSITQTLSDAAAGIGLSLTTGSYYYSLFNFGEAANALESLVNSKIFSFAGPLFGAFGAVAFVLLLVGLVRSWVGKRKSGVLILGLIVAALVALPWWIMVHMTGALLRTALTITGFGVGGISITAAPALVLLLSIVALVLLAVSKASGHRANSKQRKAAAKAGAQAGSGK